MYNDRNNNRRPGGSHDGERRGDASNQGAFRNENNRFDANSANGFDKGGRNGFRDNSRSNADRNRGGFSGNAGNGFNVPRQGSPAPRGGNNAGRSDFGMNSNRHEVPSKRFNTPKPVPNPMPNPAPNPIPNPVPRPVPVEMPKPAAPFGDYDDLRYSNVIFGRNAVTELLKVNAGTIDKLYIRMGIRDGSLKVIEALARQMGVPLIDAPQTKLDDLAGGTFHQGIVAIVAEKSYCTIDDILEIARARGEKPFIVICDGVEDPHNLGAIIRSCECAGVHGVIIPKRRSCSLSAYTAKSSAGAVEYMAVAKVANLASAIDELKEKGLWIFAAEAGGVNYFDCDMSCPAALILGGEDSGVSRLLKEKSDYIVSVPMHGYINSLNVSAAAAVLINEIARQHNR